MWTQKQMTRSQREFVKVLLLGGLILLFLCILFRNRWPAEEDFRPEVFEEPVQEPGDLPPPFDVTQKGYTYTVYPQFDYEIWGMVVSSHYAGSFLDYAHEMWKDYLNIKDLCVVWGKNLETGAFRRIKFWSRDFTCYYSWSDPETGRQFSLSHISNNHLITEDALLRKLIKSVKRGDQVHLQGWLAKYGHKGSRAVRGTSTTRKDTGGQACETVYVTEFEILKRANPGWRSALPVSLLIIGSCLALLFLF
ncbi:MAG: hypothetical protein OEW18_04450 [Candidatus Aminicenantes bacterium]|nr:hypothetical protein [Candidatus Aminicenantes bacterium]